MAYQGMEHVKAAYERLQGRLAGIRREGERIAARAFAVAEVNGTAAGMGYANERWGDAPKDDPSGFREVKVLGCPVDLGAGLITTAVALLGGLGAYEEHGFNVGQGFSAAFSYRFGGEFGRRAAKEGGKTKTSGAAPELAGQARQWGGGRQYHVQYANQ